MSYQNESCEDLEKNKIKIETSAELRIAPFWTKFLFFVSFIVLTVVALQVKTTSTYYTATFLSDDDLIEDFDLRGISSYSSLAEEKQKVLFDLFISKYGKNYRNSTEKELKYQRFINNLATMDERNRAERDNGGSAVHGISKFSDMSETEFKNTYLTAIKPDETEIFTSMISKSPSYEGDDEYVTWEGVYTNEVIDQGYCGSCWAYSVTQQMEADGVRLGLIDINTTLSAEQILSCDTRSFACDGGWTERAYQYIINTGGIALEKDYPYTSYYTIVDDCNSKSSDYFMTIDGYYLLESEDEMIEYVKSTGPLSVCLDATEWLTYKKGVISVCQTDVNHCVQVVGVDTNELTGFWKIRNTWGTDWGEDGYIRITLGQNTCNIANDPTFTLPWLLSR